MPACVYSVFKSSIKQTRSRTDLQTRHSDAVLSPV